MGTKFIRRTNICYKLCQNHRKEFTRQNISEGKLKRKELKKLKKYLKSSNWKMEKVLGLTFMIKKYCNSIIKIVLIKLRNFNIIISINKKN